jgi:predicted acetyltransferase
MLQGLYLVEPTMSDADAAGNLMDKWRAYGGRINPGLIRKLGSDYSGWLNEIKRAADESLCEADDVPQTFYWLKSSEGTILGAASLRHYLNESNIIDGGHVAYGIAPEYRGRGLGNEILRLAVEKLIEMKIYRILATCDADNFASQKVILHNGGVLENQMLDEDGVLVNRYWIEISIKNI